ncbi:MAG TPA: NAD-dependent epimerase/dehydratase family protein [Micromonosporaceae bacterium]
MSAERQPNAPLSVLVTGASRYLGAHVASRLAVDPRFGRVVGLDSFDPPPELAALLESVELVRAEPGAMLDAIADIDPQVLVHLAIATTPDPHRGGRAGMKEQNIVGTMQVLAAGQRVAGLRKLVVRSSTAAYGASFRDPAVFTEDTEPRETPRGGFARDVLDIEGYVRGFRRRRPDAVVTVLRLAPLIGATADTTLTRYLAQPVIPTVFGRDPRLQFLHVDDALEVLHRAVTEDHDGTFNVAGPGVLTLSQAVRRAGRIPAPIVEPALSAAAELAGPLSVTRYGLDQVDLLVHGRVVDVTKLAKEFGFVPRSTAEAFDDFVRAHADGEVINGFQLAVAEQVILAGIRRLRATLREPS